jgi:hypothetical protein
VTPPLPELLPLCAFAFLAGLLDSIVGGGGLVQVPALFILMPGTAAATLLGTNKCVSVVGTLGATAQYLRRVRVPWRLALSSGITALPFSFLGARIITGLDPSLLRPLILVLLVGVLAYTLLKPTLGSDHAPWMSAKLEIAAGLITGAAIGFYDGFFGPGTGSFLIFAYVGLFGYDFLSSSAAAKIVNLLTNLAAIAWFSWSGHVIALLAIPMAACNLTGALIGSRLALRHGSRFVRRLFIVVVGLLILRYGYDLGFGHHP